ncbi:carboxymuconolactone decarboxylase family protein [Micrococcus porci]|uniref:carboxymuconolactone decarboxylase family protein n=1 Tax=Micrococcus porci TaxID=2856555 RepID=UPI001CC95DDA|nr:carboxymuconolactone decarboxylase family protein [Micrococcus porci]UBH25924.1 carboxymuconolactone decarboxylase family protein [Micrococcus porci]
MRVGLARVTVNLVKLHVSQLNGCAPCLRLHPREAAAGGWESGCVSAEAGAALALAEDVTHL